MSTGLESAAVWQQVEFGGYAADLAQWRELAFDRDPVLELGCGSGRVALDLAASGHEVIGVDLDPELLAELERGAERAGVSVDGVVADLCDLDLARRFGLVLSPMQLIQMISASERVAALEGIARHLEPGGLAAFAIVEPDALIPAAETDPDPLPDMREIDGWVYSSRPLWVESGEGGLVVKRLRERVSPEGDVARGVHEEHLALIDAAALESEASATGLSPAGRRRIDNGPQEADSTVVILERS